MKKKKKKRKQYHQVHAHPPCRTTGQCIQVTRCRGKLADQGDGRLTSQNNHPVWVWMPGSFIEPKKEAMMIHSQKAE